MMYGKIKPFWTKQSPKFNKKTVQLLEESTDDYDMTKIFSDFSYVPFVNRKLFKQ